MSLRLNVPGTTVTGVSVVMLARRSLVWKVVKTLNSESQGAASVTLYSSFSMSRFSWSRTLFGMPLGLVLARP